MAKQQKLRDRIATSVLTRLLRDDMSNQDIKAVALDSYRIADAMLWAREVPLVPPEEWKDDTEN